MKKELILIVIIGLTLLNCSQPELNYMTDGGFELQVPIVMAARDSGTLIKHI